MFCQNELGPSRMPSEELELLQNALEVAEVHASSGHRLDGHTELLYGLRRAEVLRQDGLPWARLLEASYRSALDRYCEAHLPRL